MAWLEITPASGNTRDNPLVCWRLWRLGKLVRVGFARDEADARQQIRAMLPPEPEPDESADVDLIPAWLRTTNVEATE